MARSNHSPQATGIKLLLQRADPFLQPRGSLFSCEVAVGKLPHDLGHHAGTVQLGDERALALRKPQRSPTSSPAKRLSITSCG